MKEIDFLPEWYKSTRRLQFSYRTQYVALAGMFVVMMVWNFTSLNSISKATAELAKMSSMQTRAQDASREYVKVKNIVAELQKKTHVIEEIDSKIDVASVLAEISFLIDKRIVLSKVEFVGEKLLDKQQGQLSSGSAVRVAKAEVNKQRELSLGDVRFKVVIYGVAADASDVAALVCKLEDSPYFCQVYPSFSRNKTMNTVGSPTDNKVQKRQIPGVVGEDKLASKNYQVSEFEISCYLGNYQ